MDYSSINFFLLLFIFIFIGNCTTLKEPERYEIIQKGVRSAYLLDNGELAIDYIVFMSKNFKSIKIYYDYFNDETNEWDRVDYVFMHDIKKEKIKDADTHFGIIDNLRINTYTGKIRTNIMLSNKSFKDVGSGVVLTDTDIINVDSVYSFYINR